MMGGSAEMDAELLRIRQRRQELELSISELTGRPGSVDAEDVLVSLQKLAAAVKELTAVERELRSRNDELQAARKECEWERQRYFELFEFCPDAYLVTDQDGVIREANEPAAALCNAPSQQLCGQHIHVLISKHQQQDLSKLIAEAVSTRQVHEIEMELLRDETTPVRVSVRVRAGREAHSGSCDLRWLIRDMTAIRHAESELSSMREQVRRSEQLSAIGTLAAGLGHDVKNLLFPMRARLDSLAEQDLPEQACEDVEGVRHTVHYLQQLANNLQLLAEKPELDHDHVGTTDVYAWWEHVEPLMGTATPRNARVLGEFDDDLPALSIAPHQLTQAVMNLVNNAGEMADRARIRIWAKRAKHGPFVRIGVSDNGPGMSPEVLRRALDPFFTTKARSRGLSTGMGLSIVRGIVKSVGGSVRIDSVPGQGTTVILRVPIAAKPASERVDQPGNLPHAAISVSDTHLASTLCTLLNLSRLPAWRTDSHDPGDSMLWIVEPNQTPSDLARAFLQEDSRRRLVLFGEQSDEWSDLAAVWIEQSASLKTIRDTLSDVAFDVLRTR